MHIFFELTPLLPDPPTAHRRVDGGRVASREHRQPARLRALRRRSRGLLQLDGVRATRLARRAKLSRDDGPLRRRLGPLARRDRDALVRRTLARASRRVHGLTPSPSAPPLLSPSNRETPIRHAAQKCAAPRNNSTLQTPRCPADGNTMCPQARRRFHFRSTRLEST